MLIAALCFQLPASGETAPEWVELIPAPNADGLVVGADGRKWTMRSVEQILAAFNRRLPIDINHATDLAAAKGGESPAVAWIERLEARNGALWGRVEWTERGSALLRDRAYRFLSPAFLHTKTGEIVQLTSAALTNTPNFDLALNRAAHQEPPIMWKDVLKALKLSESAGEAEAVTAINALQAEHQTALNAAQTPSLDKFVPRADYDVALNRATTAEGEIKSIQDKALEQTITTEVDAAQKAGKITPATRDFYVAMCRKEGGLDEFRKFVEAASPVLDPEKKPAQGKPEKTVGALTEAQKALCSQMGVSHEDYAAAQADFH